MVRFKNNKPKIANKVNKIMNKHFGLLIKESKKVKNAKYTFKKLTKRDIINQRYRSLSRRRSRRDDYYEAELPLMNRSVDTSGTKSRTKSRSTRLSTPYRISKMMDSTFLNTKMPAEVNKKRRLFQTSVEEKEMTD